MLAALVGLVVASQSANAQLIIDPWMKDCERQDAAQGLTALSAAGPRFKAVIDALRNGKRITILSPVYFPEDRAVPYLGLSWLLWNVEAEPDDRYSDGSCMSPVGGLAHELWHAYEHLQGTTDRRVYPGDNGIPRKEVLAVEFENAYRATQGLCARTVYRTPDHVLRTVPAWAYGGAKFCNLAMPEPCARRVSACAPQRTCCCWIFGGIKNPSTKSPAGGPGWETCVKEKMLPEDCKALNNPKENNCQCLGSCDPKYPKCP